MTRKKRGLSMTSILVLALVGTITAIVLGAMAVFLQTYQRSLIRSVQTSARQSVAQVGKTVEDYLDDVNSLMELLERKLEDPRQDRDDFFAAFLQIRPDVVAVTTYDAAGGLVDCRSRAAKRTEIYQNLSFDPDKMDAYAGGYVSTPHVASIFQGYYPWVVTLVAPLDAPGREEWIALDISFSSISAYLNDVGIGQHGYCYLMDERGNMVYHPQQQLLYAGLKKEEAGRLACLGDGTYVEDTVIYSVQRVPNSPWRVVGVSYIDETVNESFWQMVRIAVATAALIFAAALAVGWVLSRLLSRPLQQLENAMEAFEQDADHFAFHAVRGTREVQNLSDSFGHMVGRIQRLMTTVREEEIVLRKTELKALQAQINPHFLYNTLDSISWMCEQGKNKDAVVMVNALAQLFRISISKGHELIPIRSEVQHAKSYLQIQSVRYKDQFSYRFEVDESCLDYLCNKITLQPIIENAIYHGINGLVDEGEIIIRIESRGDDILATVEDNGVGMEPEQIEAIFRRSDTKSGIGIKNVNDRLKIWFGDAYGITIESEPDCGTRVMVRMPKKQKE